MLHSAASSLSQAELIKSAPPQQNLRRFGFRIGQFHFLVAEGLYCQLLVEPKITPLPNAPAHFVGLTNIHGNIVPCYSLSQFIGQAREPSRYAYLIGPAQSGAALLIEDIPGLINLQGDDELQALPRNLPSPIENSVEFALTSGGQTWLSLQHETLFGLLAEPA